MHFNLAENRRDPDAPFAFMATYTTQLSAQARAQHLPLGQALREYAGAANRAKLLSLLLPVQRAAETCAWLQPMIDSGEIFHPAALEPAGRRAPAGERGGAGARRRGRAHARGLAGRPPARARRSPRRSAHARPRSSGWTGCWTSPWR